MVTIKEKLEFLVKKGDFRDFFNKIRGYAISVNKNLPPEYYNFMNEFKFTSGSLHYNFHQRVLVFIDNYFEGEDLSSYEENNEFFYSNSGSENNSEETNTFFENSNSNDKINYEENNEFNENIDDEIKFHWKLCTQRWSIILFYEHLKLFPNTPYRQEAMKYIAKFSNATSIREYFLSFAPITKISTDIFQFQIDQYSNFRELIIDVCSDRSAYKELKIKGYNVKNYGKKWFICDAKTGKIFERRSLDLDIGIYENNTQLIAIPLDVGRIWLV